MNIMIYRHDGLTFDAFATCGVGKLTEFSARVSAWRDGAVQLALDVPGSSMVIYPKLEDLERMGEMLLESVAQTRAAQEKEAA